MRLPCILWNIPFTYVDEGGKKSFQGSLENMERFREEVENPLFDPNGFLSEYHGVTTFQKVPIILEGLPGWPVKDKETE